MTLAMGRSYLGTGDTCNLVSRLFASCYQPILRFIIERLLFLAPIKKQGGWRVWLILSKRHAKVKASSLMLYNRQLCGSGLLDFPVHGDTGDQ